MIGRLVHASVLATLLANATARAEDASACQAAEAFVPPSVPWIGQQIFKTAYKIRAGRAESVDVSPYRGGDRSSNRAISKAMEAFIAANYRCSGPDKEVEEYRLVNLTHDVSAVADLLPEMQEMKAAWIAQKEAAAQAGAPAPKPPARLACPLAGRPQIPNVKVNAIEGTFLMDALVEIRDGAIGAIEVKMKQGSDDARVNKLFMDEYTRTIRETYRCEGTHAFEEELVIKFSTR